MKTSFFVQLALAILFGLVAGLPQYARNALEPRAYVTTTNVVVVTRPAVVVHIHGTRTAWTETFAPLTTLTVTSETSSAIGSQVTSSSSGVASSESPTVISHLSASSFSEASSESPTSTSDLPTTLHALSSRAYNGPVSSQTPDPSPSSSASDGDGFGIGYNPYNADSSCKDSGSITEDISSLKGYGMVRLYGTDCNQLDAAMPAAKELGMKLFLGIWHCESTDTAMAEAQAIVDAVNENLSGDWSLIEAVSVGNEVISRGETSVEYLLATLKAVQNKLRQYGVPIVTVDTPDVFEGEGKALCQASDYTAINAHPFFDKSGSWTDPSRAGEFTELMRNLLNDCGHERTVITESGWPRSSDLGSDYFINENLPVPSLENHIAAIDSLKKVYADHPQDLIIFSAFDDLWKKDTAQTMGVEHYWGILN
ncbi:cell wall glucanase [Diplodia corticola]|uniref:Cell wall glucanase n=1 Tax=Diplodia corticola TaxID=236234 RepID=A0A1J9RC02_9PEZI|nr:cell wall glucanase [Diplodia corticola]OJD38088.1 cell wall glucanase [Diplodia corticola]